MPFRRLPDSDNTRTNALQNAWDKAEATDPANWAIDAATKTRIDTALPLWKQEVAERGEALSGQLEASKEEDEAQAFCALTSTHFIQVFNLGITRGVYKESDRAFYGIDGNDSNTPRITTEADTTRWANAIITGDANRITAGGTAMSNPAVSDVVTALENWTIKHSTQSGKKDEYDKEQEDVEGMRPEVDDLIVDIWDEVEFTYRKDDAPSKRRKSREWGVFYATRPGEEPENGEEPPPPVEPAP